MSAVYQKLVDEFLLLVEGGCFMILRMTEQISRMLTSLPVPSGGYTVPYLKSMLGQATRFTRPLQKDLRMQECTIFQVRRRQLQLTVYVQTRKYPYTTPPPPISLKRMRISEGVGD